MRRENGMGEIHCGIPAAYGAIQRGEDEQRRTRKVMRFDYEVRRAVEHNSRGRARTLASSGGNSDDELLRHSLDIVKSGESGDLVTDPEGRGCCRCESPGIHQRGIGVGCFPRLMTG